MGFLKLINIARNWLGRGNLDQEMNGFWGFEIEGFWGRDLRCGGREFEGFGRGDGRRKMGRNRGEEEVDMNISSLKSTVSIGTGRPPRAVFVFHERVFFLSFLLFNFPSRT